MAVVHTRFGFKTAYLQKEEVLDVAVFSTETGDVFKVGQLCQVTAAASGVPAYLSKKTSPAVGYVLIAQSDETMEYGHIPVENRDYRYLPNVAVTESTEMASTSATKKVAVYRVTNVADLISLA